MNVFEQIKNRIQLVDYVSKFINLKMQGGRYTGLCPFHAEKTASFYVDAAKNLYHCFGCGEGGDIFAFYMKFHSATKKEALIALATLAGVQIEKQVVNPLHLLKDFFMQQADGQYELFLKSRGVTESSKQKFEIGWTPSSARILKFIKDNKLNLEPYGFNDYFWKMFENRVVFPVYTVGGVLCSFGGRALDNTRAKYINGPASSYFDKSNTLYAANFAKKNALLYVVEGYLDVILMHQHNYNSVAAMGTSFGSVHLKNAWTVSNNLVIAFDGDTAGRKSASKVASFAIEMLEVGKEISFLGFPNGEDPASFLQQTQDLDSLPLRALHEYVFSEQVGESALNKVAAFNNLMQMAAKVKDPLLRSEYRKYWRSCWWKKKVDNVKMAPFYNRNLLELLLFKYVLLYNDVIDEVAEHFVKLPLHAPLRDYLMKLIRHESVEQKFIDRVQNVGVVEKISSKDDAVKAWKKVAKQIEILSSNEQNERKETLVSNFCETEWARFKKWIDNKELGG